MFVSGSAAPVYARTIYSESTQTNSKMWGPILEKAWAKVTGSYANYFGSYGSQVTWAEAGIRALTGLPVITQSPGAVNTDYTNLCTNFTTGDTNSYVMTATADNNAAAVSGCGLTNYAPYVVVKSFTATYNSVAEKLVLLRDPAGVSGYNGDWSKSDTTRWTASTIAEIPYLVDVTNADFYNKGYFVVPLSKFSYQAS